MGISARKVKDYDLYAGHAWYVPGVKGMFVLTGWFLVGMVIGFVLEVILMRYMSLHFATLVTYPVQFLPAMVYAASQSRKNMLFDSGYSLDNKHFAPYGTALAIGLTVLLTFAMMFVLELPNSWNMKLGEMIPWLGSWYDGVLKTMEVLLKGPFWSTFLLMAIMAPVFEEWLCRGMVLRGLLTKMDPYWAIVVSALFFAVIHGNPLQGLGAFIMGLVMGYVYYRTGSLLLTMVMHFVNNGSAVVVSNLDRFREMEDIGWSDVWGQEAYPFVLIASCIVLAVCVWLFSRIKVKNPWGNIDRIPPADETIAS